MNAKYTFVLTKTTQIIVLSSNGSQKIESNKKYENHFLTFEKLPKQVSKAFYGLQGCIILAFLILFKDFFSNSKSVVFVGSFLHILNRSLNNVLYRSLFRDWRIAFNSHIRYGFERLD